VGTARGQEFDKKKGKDTNDPTVMELKPVDVALRFTRKAAGI
jgi:hypothetical protein